MRSEWKVALVPLALALGCGKRTEQTSALPDDLQKDLAAVSSASADLAPAGSAGQRMRFVSQLEQHPSATPARIPRAAPHAMPMHHHEIVAAPAAEEAPAPTTTVAAETPMEAPAPAAAATSTSTADAAPTSEPTPGPATVVVQGRPAGAGPSDAGSGIGGIIGGIIGGVIIRGGMGGVDHCDPRADGRAHPPVINQPVFGLPAPTGQVFGRGGRRR